MKRKYDSKVSRSEKKKSCVVSPGCEGSPFSFSKAPIRALRDVTLYQLQTKPEEVERHSCPICLCEVQHPITLLVCGHSMCEACAIHWLNVNLSCPICKERIVYFLRGRLGESLKIYEAQVEGEVIEELNELQIENGIRRHQTLNCVRNDMNGDKRRRKMCKNVENHIDRENGTDEMPKNVNSGRHVDDIEKHDNEHTLFRVKMPNKDAAETGLITSDRYRGAYLIFDILYSGYNLSQDSIYGDVHVNIEGALGQTGNSRFILIDLMHVYVPSKMRRKGVAEALTNRGIEIAMRLGCKVRPTCSYVKETFFGKKHPDICKRICEGQ